MIYLLIPTLTFLLAFWISRYLSNPGSRLSVLDRPNQRSLHSTPTPRNGGIAILSSFIIGWVILLVTTESPLPGQEFLWSGLILTMAVSFWDDKQPLSPGPRLLVQLFAAILLTLGQFSLSEFVIPGLGHIPLGWFGVPFSLLFVVWMMNLYNFMDGMDGFAGGMGVFGFGFLAILGIMAAEPFFSMIALLLACANIGFLLQNFPPARIFMGDVGSVSMGFMAASLSLWGVREGIFDFWVAVLIFSPFTVDATLTILRRGLAGEKIWVAHRSHYYQRLVLAGWGHRKTVLSEYILMIGVGSLAIFLRTLNNEWVTATGLLACCLVYWLLARVVNTITEPKA